MEENTARAEEVLAKRRQNMAKATAASAVARRAAREAAMPVEDDEQPPVPRPKPPSQRTVRVRLLKAYWPADGREHPDAGNRMSGRKHRFDAGEVLDLPVAEARRLLEEQVEKRTLKVWDPRMRVFVEQDDSLRRPPAAVRANAYSVEDDG